MKLLLILTVVTLNAYAHDPRKQCEQGCYDRFHDCAAGPMNTTDYLYACQGILLRCMRTCALEGGVSEEEPVE